MRPIADVEKHLVESAVGKIAIDQFATIVAQASPKGAADRQSGE